MKQGQHTSFPKEQVTGQEETASSCARGGLNWVLGKNFFTESVVKHCNRLPREVVETPSLEVFKRCRNMVLRDLV